MSKDTVCIEEDIPGQSRLKPASTSNENSAANNVQSHYLEIEQLDWTKAWENQQTSQVYQAYQTLINMNDRTHSGDSRLNSPSKRESSSVKVKTEQISPFTK